MMLPPLGDPLLPRYDGEVRYRAGARVAAKQRRASTTADGPRKNRSPTVGEAKLASALRSMPTTNIQVPTGKWRMVIACPNTRPSRELPERQV